MGMISFNLTDKVEIFIDRENVEKFGVRGRVDYVTLVRCLAQGRPVGNVMIFDMLKEDDPQQRRIYAELKDLKFRIINPKGKCANPEKQIGVDVSLAVNVVKHAMKSQCDTIIIVSGDGDFIPVIEEVKDTGKKIEFASFAEGANKSLIEETDYFIYLDDLPILKAEV